ncbi:hypothetical protein CROQUDRAFT_668179 [Cronartium quercuum f. sp. fusiforme G11]|uniref:RNA-binding protein 26 n=1 Tax=Cronartium quercuum f. sp. fusiforme G11 TaxID=708437 RepID=A0A9P6NVE2_9BASI|nr:hypothetical protein CROQUDRAFT_668179 [Cronartium quercuum f. sp. fusiforme G11]
MQLDHLSAGYLKTWMISKLKPISDADPSVLSDYVTALLRHDQPTNQLKISCLNQLEDFLQKETSSFVHDLFEHLQAFDVNGRYTPPELITSGLLGKRSFSMENLSPAATTFSTLAEQTDHADTSLPIPQYTPTQSHPSFLHFPENQSGSPAPSAPFSAPSVRGQPFGGSPKPGRNAKRPRKSEICRDYHYRGFCARGDGCQFSHDDKDPNGSPRPNAPTATFSEPSHREGEASTSSQGLSRLNVIPPLPTSLIPGLPNSLPFTSDVITTLFPTNTLPIPNKKISPQPNRPPQSMPKTLRPQRSKTTLVVENIPQSSLSDRHVREYFANFGPLISVSVDVYNAQALVTFESADDASKAYSSPEPVFNNRFVKIHFRRFKAQDQQPRREGKRHQVTNQLPSYPSGPTQIVQNQTTSIKSSSERTSRSPVPNPKLESSLSQREAELREKIEEHKRLLEKLHLKQAFKRVGSIPSESSIKIEPSTSVLGLDGNCNDHHQTEEVCNRTKSLTPFDNEDQRGTDNQDIKPIIPSTENNIKRGWINKPVLKSREKSLPTNHYGTTWSKSIRSFKLDNRTSTLSIRDLPNFESRLAIQKHLEQFGTIVEIDESLELPDFNVRYLSRTSAEKALIHGRQVPGIGRITMNWLQSTTKTNAKIIENNKPSIIENEEESDGWKR